MFLDSGLILDVTQNFISDKAIKHLLGSQRILCFNPMAFRAENFNFPEHIRELEFHFFEVFLDLCFMK